MKQSVTGARIFAHVKALIVVSVLTLIGAGCGIPTEPTTPQHRARYPATPGARLPLAIYDGVFYGNVDAYEWQDSTGADSSRIYSLSHPIFFNSLGDPIRTPFGVAVELNGTLLPDSVVRFLDYSSQDLHFPDPLRWEVRGDGYFPSFTHTIQTESPIEILSPKPGDSIVASQALDFSYSAPGADSVQLSIFLHGTGVYRHDSTHTERESYSDARYWRANTGHFLSAPAFVIDTFIFERFTPTDVQISVGWGRGDTIHAGGKIFGFVTNSSTSRTYGVKY